MTKTEILPLGTVITLKNGDNTQLMIISRAIVTEEKKQDYYYDYGAVLLPEGMSTPEAVYFFNRENVGDVIFRGYENEEEKQYASKYDQMINQANIKKGTVNDLDDTEIYGF
ncbi:DUF4176 domain-containing protein [Enterococcus faecium]|uniref:DUF4176 domain-containing protein n=1 Tax=Enterococcus faecium TaxID=1352 RepID=UPI000CF337A2|nr:DUF4176 domain-containing protein [Enterococcus faecium]EKK5253783.1 DUF4176 domain-containing protein [Enterococcus faecalis]EGP4986391.1 DUF4176 domain-containing protein [Enterococcus faecium]EGP5129898.1 DUF4176 domain-containing protein [Enterococcus faecium]EME3512073.1 DUF4176 domain-containing protein [Enterococcus faecium]EME7094052.1 DUF4176 domain-containing protein [Enterococcus faecium]